MKKRKTFLGVALLVAVMVMAVGYAVINSDILTINGTATVSPSDDNFSVEFTGTPAPSADTVTATIDTPTTATLTVNGLTAKGDEEGAQYTIINKSTDLSAALSVSITNSNEEYFAVTYQLVKTTIAGQETTTILVMVEALKTPIDADATADITVTITATPEQPASA